MDFLETNVLVWGGSLRHGEAYAVGNTLDACAFPYVALLLCKQNQVEVRYPITPCGFLPSIKRQRFFFPQHLQ